MMDTVDQVLCEIRKHVAAASEVSVAVNEFPLMTIQIQVH